MPQVNLTIDTIGDLDDGMARAVINECLRKAREDADDRGDDEKVRKVIIQVTMEKLKDKPTCVIGYQAKAVIPDYVGGNTIGRLAVNVKGKAHELVFQSENAENPDQSTLPFEEGETK